MQIKTGISLVIGISLILMRLKLIWSIVDGFECPVRENDTPKSAYGKCVDGKRTFFDEKYMPTAYTILCTNTTDSSLTKIECLQAANSGLYASIIGHMAIIVTIAIVLSTGLPDITKRFVFFITAIFSLNGALFNPLVYICAVAVMSVFGDVAFANIISISDAKDVGSKRRGEIGRAHV